MRNKLWFNCCWPITRSLSRITEVRQLISTSSTHSEEQGSDSFLAHFLSYCHIIFSVTRCPPIIIYSMYTHIYMYMIYSTIALCILHATPCRHGVYMTCTRTFPRALAMHTGIAPQLRPHTKTRPLRGDSSNTTSSNLYLVSEQSVVPPLTCIHPS